MTVPAVYRYDDPLALQPVRLPGLDPHLGDLALGGEEDVAGGAGVGVGQQQPAVLPPPPPAGLSNTKQYKKLECGLKFKSRPGICLVFPRSIIHNYRNRFLFSGICYCFRFPS